VMKLDPLYGDAGEVVLDTADGSTADEQQRVGRQNGAGAADGDHGEVQRTVTARSLVLLRHA
jgi:hypothetical protein